MTAKALRRAQYVTIAGGPQRSRLSCAARGLALGALSVVLQQLLAPLVAPDSYQLLLSAVAIGAMYAGVWAGASALLVTASAKWFVFLPAESSLHLFGIGLLLRFGLFVCLGLLICWLGQKMHASRREVRLLSGLLPICAWCKRVRDDQGYWKEVQSYLDEHATHSACPECAAKLLEEANGLHFPPPPDVRPEKQ